MRNRASSGPDSTPWYTVRLLWFILAMFGVLVTAALVTIYLAGEDFDGAVATEYVKKDLAIQLATRKSEQAKAMGLKATVFIDREQNEVVIEISPALTAPFLKLNIIHPTRQAEDQHIVLTAEGRGHYRGSFTTMTSLHGYLQLQDGDETWQVAGEWHRHEYQVPLF